MAPAATSNPPGGSRTVSTPPPTPADPDAERRNGSPALHTCGSGLSGATRAQHALHVSYWWSQNPALFRAGQAAETSPPTSVTGGEAPLSARPSTEMGGAQLVSYPRTQAADFSESALPRKGNETISLQRRSGLHRRGGTCIRHFRIGRKEPR